MSTKPMETQLDSDARLTTALRAGGHRVTSQRLVLHRVLRELDRHVTAEELLRAAAPRLPGLSLPTVYATLDLFDQLAVVRRVNAGGGAVRYDPCVTPHQHFVCRRCGKVVDVEAPIDEAVIAAPARAAGLGVEEVEVVLRGLCADCSA